MIILYIFINLIIHGINRIEKIKLYMVFMEIKLATKLDIPDIMELIELCIMDLEGQSIYQ